METKPNLLELLPYWITGDSYRTLKNYDVNSRKKISQLGWFVLLPTMLWFITGYLAQSELLGGSVLLGLTTALICAIFIFIIERSIVMARRSHWALVCTRVVLGLLVAGIGSFIIDLVVFKSDIDHYAIQKKQEEFRLHRDSIARLELAWTDSLHREMTGKGGSRQRGLGAISQVLKHQVLDLKMVGARLDFMQATEGKTLFDADGSLQQGTSKRLGLNTMAHRAVLLHELIAKDSFTGVMWLALLALGVLIEVIPIISKLATPKSAFELDVEAYEEMLANRRKTTLQKSNFYAGMTPQERLVHQAIEKSSIYPFK